MAFMKIMGDFNMSNIILGWPNRADLVTLSGGSWTSLDNLKNRNKLH